MSPPASRKQEGHSLDIFHALSALLSFPSSAILMRKERRWEEEEKIEGGKTEVKISLLYLDQIIKSPTLGGSLRPVLFVKSTFIQAHTVKSRRFYTLLLKKAMSQPVPLSFPCDSVEVMLLCPLLPHGLWQICGPSSKVVLGSQMRKSKIIFESFKELMDNSKIIG